MNVLVLSIAPGSCEVDFPHRMARWLGLRLADMRQFEEDLSSRQGGFGADVSSLRPIQRRHSRTNAFRWSMSSAQLSTRYAEDVLQTIADGPCVIASWSAPMLARSVVGAVRVRLVAPQHVRVERIMRRHAYVYAETARLELESAEGAIARSVQCLTGTCWRDDQHFDLSLDTASFGEDACLRILASTVHAPICRPNTVGGCDLETALEKLAAAETLDPPLLHRLTRIQQLSTAAPFQF